MIKDDIKLESPKIPSLLFQTYRSRSRPLETNSTVENVGLYVMKLLSKNESDPTV